MSKKVLPLAVIAGVLLLGALVVFIRLGIARADYIDNPVNSDFIILQDDSSAAPNTANNDSGLQYGVPTLPTPVYNNTALEPAAPTLSPLYSTSDTAGALNNFGCPPGTVSVGDPTTGGIECLPIQTQVASATPSASDTAAAQAPELPATTAPVGDGTYTGSHTPGDDCYTYSPTTGNCFDQYGVFTYNTVSGYTYDAWYGQNCGTGKHIDNTGACVANPGSSSSTTAPGSGLPTSTAVKTSNNPPAGSVSTDLGCKVGNLVSTGASNLLKGIFGVAFSSTAKGGLIFIPTTVSGRTYTTSKTATASNQTCNTQTISSQPFVQLAQAASNASPAAQTPVAQVPAAGGGSTPSTDTSTGFSVSFPFGGGKAHYDNFGQYFIALMKWALDIGESLAALIIIWGSFQYVTSAGDESKAKAGKDWIIGAVVGFVLLLLIRFLLPLIGV